MLNYKKNGKERALNDHKSFMAWHNKRIESMGPYWIVDEPHPTLQIARSFERVEVGIKSGDRRAIEVAIHLICEDPKMPLGKTIKCTLARALYAMRRHFSQEHIHRISDRVDVLENLPFPPTELKYIRKLLKHED